MTRLPFTAFLIYKGREAAGPFATSVPDDPEGAEAALAFLLASLIRSDGGGRYDLPDYALELHDGDPDTPVELFTTDEWVDQ